MALRPRRLDCERRTAIVVVVYVPRRRTTLLWTERRTDRETEKKQREWERQRMREREITKVWVRGMGERLAAAAAAVST